MSGMSAGAIPRSTKNTVDPTVLYDSFEKLDLNPQSNLKGELKNALGNPTPV
jgi:hypothetical protein